MKKEKCSKQKEVKNHKQGFTLLELLIVVLIIGILAAIALPQYKKVKEKTIITEGMQIAKQVANANQRYYLIYGEYAEDINNLDINFSGQPSVIAEINRIETDNFTLSSTGRDKTLISVIQRKPFNKIYYLYVSIAYPDIIKCFSIKNSGIQKELCNKINSDGHL